MLVVQEFTFNVETHHFLAFVKKNPPASGYSENYSIRIQVAELVSCLQYTDYQGFPDGEGWDDGSQLHNAIATPTNQPFNLCTLV